MANYTTRVELHNAAYSDYENLHAAMEKVGFSRIIAADDGTRYQLPTAEYDRSTALTCEQVLNQAKVAANSTGKGNAVLVTETTRRMWNGLQVVGTARR
jgi:hypothetical protein